jgi:TP901 family phage tail tape measure protein
MADKIQIPVEIRPHRFEEIKQQLNTILDPKTLSADANILFQNVLGSLSIAQAEMTKQMGENKFNMPALNLKTIDKQMGALIKKVQEDFGQALPQAFVEAQKELEVLNNKMAINQREQKQLIDDIKSTPSIQEKVKSSAPAGLKKFGIAGDEAATVARVLQLEKQISETKDKRKLGPLQAELEYQGKVLEIQKQTNKELQKKQGTLAQLQSAESTMAAMAEVQRDNQLEAMKASKGTAPQTNALLAERKKLNEGIVQSIKFGQDYNVIKARSADAEKRESAAIKGTTNSIAEKSVKTLGMNLIYQQLRKILFGSIRTIRELDKALTDASVVTGMTRQQTWGLIGSYQELGKTTGLATSEVASIVTQFLRQGRSLEDAMKLAEVAAKSAKVAGISANEAVNFLTSAVNGFGLSADQAEDIADKFAAIAARSATSFAELASAMSRVSPTAKSAGVSVDFMMGVIAKGIETTREAPESIGTAFKTIFARMREVTDLGKSMEDGMNLNRVEKALLSVGVPLRDVGGQFRNLEHVLTDVGNKWETLTSVEQAYLATALAGSRQQPRLLAIFNDFARTKELIQISSEATGGLQLQHMKYMDGMEAALARLRTAWEGFVTSIVSADIVVFFFQIMQGTIEGVTSIIQSIGPSTTIMIGLITALSISYALAGDRIGMFTKALKENVIIGGIWNSITATGNTILGASKALQLGVAQAGKKTTNALREQVAATALKMGVTLSDNTIQEISLLLRSKEIAKQKLGLKMLWNEIIAKKAKIVWDKITIIGQTILNLVMMAGTAANFAYAASLATATFGLILIVPLVLGLVAGLIEFVKGGKKSSESAGLLGEVFTGIGTVLKSIVEIFVDVLKVIFEVSKIFTVFALKLFSLGLKFSGINILIKIFSVSLKAINLIFRVVGLALKAIGRFLQDFVNFVSDGIEAVINFVAEMTGLKWVIDAIMWVINAFDSGIQSLTNSVNNAMTPLSEFGKEANKATVELGEFSRKTKALKRLAAEFDTLSKKVSKTPEELQRMDAILNELKDFEIDGKNFDLVGENMDGVLTLNQQLLNETLDQLDAQADKKTKELADIVDDAVAAYGKAGTSVAGYVNNDARGAFTEEGIIEAAKFLGQQYARNFIDGLKEDNQISDELAMQLQSAVNTAVAKAPKSFFDTFIIGADFKEEDLQKFIENLTGASKTNLEQLNKTMTDISENKLLTERQKVTQGILEQRAAYQRLTATLITFGDNTQDVFARDFAGSVMESGKILTNLFSRSFTIDAIVNMQMSGMSLVAIEDFLVNTQDEIRQKVSFSSGLQSALTAQFNKAVEDAFSQTGAGVEAGLKAYAQILKTAGFQGDEFKEKFVEFSNTIVSASAQATADLLEDQRKANEKLFTLPEKIKKGDFKDYTSLVAEFGVDTVEQLLNGSEDGVANFLAKQTQKTLDGIDASISKIVTTASVLQRPLTELEEQEISMLETMRSYYQDIVAVEQLRTYQIKQSNDLLKEAGDLMKLQEGLFKFGMEGDAPIMKTLDNLINKTQELAEQQAIKTLDDDLQRLSEYGSFNKDGIFQFLSADETDINAAKTALDNYTGSLANLVNIQNQSYERQKKIVEDRYKAEIDVIKTSNDEKWKAIEYGDKLIESEEKIAASRRALMGLALSGASSGMLDNAQKDLEKMKKERQKMIEQQMVEEAQKQLEKERDDAIQALGQEQVSAMQNLTSAIFDLTDAVQVNSNRQSAATGGSVESGGLTTRTFTNADNVGVY